MSDLFETMVQGRTIRLSRRRVGTKYVFTSPDVPELHVSHADACVAWAGVPSAVEAIVRVKQRLSDEQDRRRVMSETA